MNRETVAAHRHDELAHSKIFKSLTQKFIPFLNAEQKSFFAEILPKPVLWFADLELDLWEDILLQLDIKGVNDLIEDSRALNCEAHKRVNYSEIVSLAEEVGLSDRHENRFTFDDLKYQ